MFIVIEGTDGSGKGTQTLLLKQKLLDMGKKVEEIHFPQYGQKSAAMVEEYLNGAFGNASEVSPEQTSIFFAVDRYAASFKIREWLQEEKIVICNRYVGSNMGHQGGKIKNEKKRKEYFAWNYHLEYEIFKIPKPDVNIILHVTPEISQKLVDQKPKRDYLHGKKRDIHEDDIDHLKNAEASYLFVASQFPEFYLVECVENNDILPVEVIQEKIWKLLPFSSDF